LQKAQPKIASASINLSTKIGFDNQAQPTIGDATTIQSKIGHCNRKLTQNWLPSITKNWSLQPQINQKLFIATTN